MDGEKSDVAKREEAILAFWKENKIFEKSLAKQAPNGEFVFYDGPPFATGLPHSGSLLSSVSKDVIPRYKTMRGYYVRRRWGWDTHGLPIESLVEKKLGLKTKKDILTIGVKKFNETARSMVLEYVQDWKRYVERVGRWVDFDNSYKTMDVTYIESVWWALKEIYKKGNLYEGRKVLMYCLHCETPLAKAEIAMDNTYQDITEEAVTVKFKVKNPEKHNLPANTYLLAWTTTPWSLPGDVALAVGKDIEYGIREENGEHLISAGKGLSASALLGLEYEPLYEIAKVRAHTGKKWVVLPASFVSTEEGTGIVHTAVIYGEDDYQLGLKEGLPMVPLLKPNGTYNDDAPEFIRGKYIKKAEADIKADLEQRGLLYKKEAHTHAYPHCYRCGTPLIYNAVSSWFINIQKVKATMLAENEKVNWFPEHLKHGRFMKNVEAAPDWTISRNRFWASPLPIWKDKEGNVTVISSLEELKVHTKKSGNRYFVMRHGESEKNIRNIVSSRINDGFHLTKKGMSDAKKNAAAYKDKGITRIFSSPLLRTRETAEITAEALGLPVSAVTLDNRLAEYDSGVFNNKLDKEWWDTYPDPSVLFEKGPEGGTESINDMRIRFGEFLYEIETRFTHENILVVSHEWPLLVLRAVSQGADARTTAEILKMKDARNKKQESLQPAEICELPFVPLPHNDDYELDLHLPYIDEVELVGERGEKLTRIPEVVDCWVESGCMPFAEYHYPFENRAEFEKRSPGDFVSEYISQTRAWFYYMHAIGAQLFGRLAFKNIVTTGIVLAANGEKISKSKKNYTDPYVLFDSYGADAFRYYLMSSVLMQAEDLMFRDEDVKEVYGRVVNILRNTHAFYSLYKAEAGAPSRESKHVLDRWIVARFDEMLTTVTEAFDRYDITHATRPLREFIEDFSTWYVRRSRNRVKGEDAAEKVAALSTMRYILREFSKVIAPVMPFIAEEIFQSVKTDSDPESVHLSEWPEIKKKLFDFGGDRKLLAEMADARALASLALEARQKANIKVRQPLKVFEFKGSAYNISTGSMIMIADEINVKEVRKNPALLEDIFLDTTITEELKKEGETRDVLRAVQDLRKQAGLMPQDRAVLVLAEGERTYEVHRDALMKAANIERIEQGDTTHVRKA
jgi:isoleucyl-tRNA synthetase